MSLAGKVELYGEETKYVRVSAAKRQGEGRLERFRSVCEDMSNMDLKVVGWNVVNWISTAQIHKNGGLV